jgi:tetratricopeptide (TPR) repeat protein
MRKPARFVRIPFVLQVVLLLAPSAFAQGQTQKWTEVRSPHFLVATNGSERQGRQLAGRFEAIRSVFEQTLGLRVESGKPFFVMGFKDEKSMRAALPRFWEEKGRAHPVGWFLPGEDKIYAVIRLDAGEDGPYGIVYHEYTHMVLDLNVRALPLWMEEGLAEFYGFSTISGTDVGLGRPDANCILRLRAGKMLPLAELFRVTHDSPYYNEAGKAQTFYAQSWALTHYLMLAEKTKAGQRNRLSRFLALRGQGIDEDEVTRQIFADSPKLQAELGRYVERSSFPYVLVKTKAGVTSESYGARMLSAAETAARLGDFLLHDRRPQDAQPLLEEALRLQPNLASAQESLGFLFMRQGDRAKALRWFDQAIANDSRSFLAHYYHATLTQIDPEAADRYGQAEASLGTALRLNPHFAPAYVALAKVYLSDDQKVQRALELVRKAVDLEPGSFADQMMLGSVLVRLGRYEEALKLATAIERSARSQDDKNRVRSFIESLRQVQGRTDAGLEPKRDGEPGMMENGEPPARVGSRPVSYAWSILDRPTLGSNALLAGGSGDALYKSFTYDEVWAATIKALTKGYEILLSDKHSGHILAEPVATSDADRASGVLEILVQQRGADVGVNINIDIKTGVSPSSKTSLYGSLFEDIAVILSAGVIEDTGTLPLSFGRNAAGRSFGWIVDPGKGQRT